MENSVAGLQLVDEFEDLGSNDADVLLVATNETRYMGLREVVNKVEIKYLALGRFPHP